MDEMTRIYIQLDPNDEMAEVHENNNKGWKTLGEHPAALLQVARVID